MTEKPLKENEIEFQDDVSGRKVIRPLARDVSAHRDEAGNVFVSLFRSVAETAEPPMAALILTEAEALAFAQTLVNVACDGNGPTERIH